MIDKILSAECVNAMLNASFRMIREIGIQTNREDLLSRAGKLQGLRVSGSRIHVETEVLNEVLQLLRRPGKPPKPRPLHPTMGVSNRPTLIADYKSWKLRPLTRADVVDGTKLIHALSSRNVVGTTCGTPQDTVLPMQGIEQYVIGYRHNKNGGSTSVPATPETAGFFSEIREAMETPNQERKPAGFAVWLPSPLRLEGNEVDDVLDYKGKVGSFRCGSMPIMGLTGPVDPIGIYTLALAEAFGSAAILHRLFPEASFSINPHPQPMDVRSGLISFGTLEWNRLSLMKKIVFEHLKIPSGGNKDTLTSACMPDAQAQADKMAGIAFGVANGYTYFNLFPVCEDEGWSCEQLVLDVEYVHTAWQTIKVFDDAGLADKAFETISQSVRENTIPGEMEDTVSRMRENYFAFPLKRVFSSNQWTEGGRPDPVEEAGAYAKELIQKADFHPPEDSWKKVLQIYHKACRHFQTEPMKFE